MKSRRLTSKLRDSLLAHIVFDQALVVFVCFIDNISHPGIFPGVSGVLDRHKARGGGL